MHRSALSMSVSVALLLLLCVSSCSAGAVISIVGRFPATSTSNVTCQSPALYIIGDNAGANDVVDVSYTFDDPAAVASPTWYSVMASRLSTCRFKFNGNNDDDSNGAQTATAVNCGALTGACRRCTVLGPCLCSKVTGASATVNIWFQYSTQDGTTKAVTASGVQTSSVTVFNTGKPGCPVDWSSTNSPISQISALPAFSQTN